MYWHIVNGAEAIIRLASNLVPPTPEALELTMLANLTDPPRSANPKRRRVEACWT